MKSLNTLYYLLFVLVVLGAFASMAQNNYGLTITGIASFGFSVIFIYVIIQGSRQEEKGRITGLKKAELIALALLALLFGFRSLFIPIPFGELLFFLSLIFLALVYFAFGYLDIKFIRPENGRLAFTTGLYYASLILFLLSFLLSLVSQFAARISGYATMVSLIMLIILIVVFRKNLVYGEYVSALQFLGRIRNKSGLLLITFTVIISYFLLNRANILPNLYSDKMPAGYYELIQQAEGSQTVNPNAGFEEYKKEYDEFIKKYY